MMTAASPVRAPPTRPSRFAMPLPPRTPRLPPSPSATMLSRTASAPVLVHHHAAPTASTSTIVAATARSPTGPFERQRVAVPYQAQ